LNKAFDALEELLHTAPDYSPALLMMTVIFCLEGRKIKAQEFFQRLLQRNVQISPLLNKVSEQFRSHGKRDEALLIVQAMIENKINDEETGKLLDDLQKNQN
jgi:hypothetical protein